MLFKKIKQSLPVKKECLQIHKDEKSQIKDINNFEKISKAFIKKKEKRRRRKIKE